MPQQPPPAPPPTAAAPTGPEALLGDVVDPWSWAPSKLRNGRAYAREHAIEDIGPFERARPGDPASPLVNSNADYWTRLVGIAWDRDVDIDFDREPVDLDGDGRPDTTVTRHIHAKGGILANPELFGLTPTPDDPRGRAGRISVSTGVLGLREPLGPDSKPTGQVGMTCWLCHGEANPVGGAIVLGLPGASFDYGLLLATAAVLDDCNAVAADYRRARGFPSGRTVRARLLLAGPGRQDLTGEFGLDVTVPGYHSARYPGTARVRQGTRGLVNPISVPTILAAPGLALENWSGSEASDAPWLERLTALGGEPPVTAGDDPQVVRRALLFDLRNLGTLGLQQDSFPGLLWADAIYGHATLSPGAMREIPTMYAAPSVRAVLEEAFQRPRGAPEAIARGREPLRRALRRNDRQPADLQARPTRLRGRQAGRTDPVAHRSDQAAGGEAGGPLRRLPFSVAARGQGAPGGEPAAARPLHPLPRRAHPRRRVENDQTASIDPALLPTAALPLGRKPGDEVAFCEGCHSQHRDFGPQVFSSSRLFPFDADGDGDAQLHPEADWRAGGIGTDPWLAFDVQRGQWPFSIDVPTISDPVRAGHVGQAHIGAAWVRAAPLVGLTASAPYLHNGSVPSLRALLDPPARRPKTFPLGRAGFVFDTRLPGNGNQGHDFGTALTPSEKDDLTAYLESL